MIWPGDLVLSGLGTDAESVTSLRWDGADTVCSHCGKPVRHGDPYSPATCSSMFSDTRDLAAFTGIVCAGCSAARSKLVMNFASYVVFTRSAAYPIAKDAHKAWLLLDPPEPPFLAVHTTATMQHLLWRTPVTLSRDLLYLRMGAALLTIRRQRLIAALSIAADVRARRIAAEGKAGPSMYLHVDRRAAFDPAHGRLSPRATVHMTDAERRLMNALTPGETWAVGLLATDRELLTEQPEPIRLKGKTK